MNESEESHDTRSPSLSIGGGTESPETQSLSSQLLGSNENSRTGGIEEYGKGPKPESTLAAAVQDSSHLSQIPSPGAHNIWAKPEDESRTISETPQGMDPSQNIGASYLASSTSDTNTDEEVSQRTQEDSPHYQAPTSAGPKLSHVRASSTNVCLKLLVSNNIAGSIIGKSGESILKMQRQCRCRIKLSQSNECFPGTQDRVCLLQGDDAESVKEAMGLILEKFREVREAHYMAPSTGENVEGGSGTNVSSPRTGARGSLFAVRILVPSLACGMLIGRGGSNIRGIADETKAKIQLAQKEDFASLQTSERILSVTGSLKSCRSCICKVADALATHPEVSQYSNMTTSYSKAGSGGATRSSSGSGHGDSSPQRQGLQAQHFHTPAVVLGDILPTSSGTNRLALSTAHVHGHQQFGLPVSPGGTAAPASSLAAAVGESYLPSYEHSRQGAIGSTQGNTVLILPGGTYTSSPGGRGGSMHLSQDSLAQGTRLEGRTLLSGQVSGSQLLRSSSPRTSATEDEQIKSVQMVVPDALVGYILGRGGSYLAELQGASGARIEVSPRGEFVPGTTNRVVTITGSAQCCETAKRLISKKLAHHSSSQNP